MTGNSEGKVPTKYPPRTAIHLPLVINNRLAASFLDAGYEEITGSTELGWEVESGL